MVELFYDPPPPIWFQQSRREKNLQKVAFGSLVASSSVPARSWQSRWNTRQGAAGKLLATDSASDTHTRTKQKKKNILQVRADREIVGVRFH